jgi:hypothetical protein
LLCLMQFAMGYWHLDLDIVVQPFLQQDQ